MQGKDPLRLTGDGLQRTALRAPPTGALPFRGGGTSLGAIPVPERMTPTDPAGARLRTVMIRVLAVQAVAILFLWFLQSRYGR